jgi:hypothetical protein
MNMRLGDVAGLREREQRQCNEKASPQRTALASRAQFV